MVVTRLTDSGRTASPQTAVVTGASSGIGAATASALADAGFRVVLGGRRKDRLDEVAGGIGPAAGVLPVDVTDPASVEAFAAGIAECSVLVCNAGLALGADQVAAADDAQWRTMWETNVLGVVRTVRALLPALTRSGDGRIVVVTSLAAHQAYPGGAGYASAKHAAAVVCDTLRMELVGSPVRVIEVAPGMTDTEFSVVRFGDDSERSKTVYDGMTPLSPADVAEAITWAVTRPAHVTVARLDLFPRDQATATLVHRR